MTNKEALRRINKIKESLEKLNEDINEALCGDEYTEWLDEAAGHIMYALDELNEIVEEEK